MVGRRRPTRNEQQARGVTLLELLIVMTIMLMVTAAAIPVVMPALQNRRMREASRLASSFISGARARAIETGRPAGVMIERFNGLPFSMNLSYVEVPPPYAGDTRISRAVLTVAGVFPTQNARITNFPAVDVLWKNSVRFGDVVRFNYKGPTYVLASQATLPDPNAGKVIIDPPNVTPWHLIGAMPLSFPPNYGGPTGVPYEIFRQPVRSSATPLQLPEGTVIDLMNSGVAGNVFPPVAVPPAMWPTTPPVTFNPVIVFSPNGSVASVAQGPTGALARPQGPIFLLLGRRELMADVSRSGTAENMFDSAAKPENLYLSNFWVTVGYQTGQVTVAENGTTTSCIDISGARKYALGGQSAGGR
jgi:prepilin-type N-terminal cleavage/methylation domain-containing protein